MISIGTIALAVAAVVIAGLAYSFGVKWLSYRASLLIELSRMDRLEAEMAKHKATHDRLEKLSGAAFDRAYVSDMLADHRKDVADFKHQAMGAKDPDVKQFASKTLPTLKEHLKMVEDLSKEVGANAAMGKTKTGTRAKAKTQ